VFAHIIGSVLTPLHVDIEPRRGYLYVRFSGPYSTAAACTAYTQTLQGAARHRETRILIDCTAVSGPMTTVDRRDFGQFMAEEQVRMSGQLAAPPQVGILVTSALMDPNRFTQVVANNRGVRMRSSESLQELLSWLEV